LEKKSFRGNFIGDQSIYLVKKNYPLIKFFIYCFTVKMRLTMNVNIQTVRFDADSKLMNHINQKMEKLNTFHDRIIKVDVFLKLDNVVHKIKDKIAEIRIQVPRHQLFVKSTSKSFEESFDNAFDSIVNQIKRKKQKQAA